MPVYSPIVPLTAPVTRKRTRLPRLASRFPTSISFYTDEATQYLVYWCQAHHGWAPEALGSFNEKVALERFTRNAWAWEMKWSTQSTYEHPSSRVWQNGKRHCFILAERAFKEEDCVLHEKSSDLRAWVTCWEDDTISVKINML